MSNPNSTEISDISSTEAPNNQNNEPRRSRKMQGPHIGGQSKEHWSRCTGLYENKADAEDDESVFDSVEYSFVTDHIEIPCELPDGPSNPRNHGEAVSGPHAKGWIEKRREKSQPLRAHDAFEWVSVP